MICFFLFPQDDSLTKRRDVVSLKLLCRININMVDLSSIVKKANDDNKRQLLDENI